MNNCTPTGPTPAVENPCELLPQLRAAYFALIAGQARFEIRNGDQWLSFQRGDAKTLQHEIHRLEIICASGANHGRAIRVGPYRPAHAHHRRNRMGLY